MNFSLKCIAAGVMLAGAVGAYAQKGETVKISSFGTFSVRAAKTASNAPQL